MEEFKQKRFFNSKRVEFEFDGITFYSGNFLNAKEVFIPFDEIIPDAITRETKTSKLFIWITIVSGLILSLALWDIFKIPFAVYMVLVFFSGLLFAIFLLMTIFSRKYMLYITTISGYLIDFYDRNPSKEAIDEFLKILKIKTFAYLKEKYAIIDIDLPVEKQIENLNFLKERNVITEKEYEALKEKLKNININVKGFKF
ncbi:MAG: hypothetical protein RQ864_00450 [Lutibacter sp.]|nr:hypothetical protein [Lutibacter sp.]MDT8416250.1 hypothetical protein [Lutibacter sp.]